MFQDGSGGRPTDSPLTQDRTAYPHSHGERSAGTGVAQSLPVELLAKHRRPDATVVPRPEAGPPRRTITAPAEATAYLPTGLLTGHESIVALCLRKVHTAEPGATARTGSRNPVPHQPQAQPS